MSLNNAQRPKKRKRQQILVSCNSCRQRHVKCDGVRPICTPCHSRSKSNCVFDTQAEDETRISSLKRNNKALQDRLSALERSFKHICELPEDEAQSFIKHVRQTADPLSTLVSLSIGMPATSLEHQAAQAVLPRSQNKLEHELMVTNPFAYETKDTIDIGSLVHEIPADLFSLEPLRMLRRRMTRSVCLHIDISSHRYISYVLMGFGTKFLRISG